MSFLNRTGLLLAGLSLFLGLFQLIVVLTPTRYLGFAELEWEVSPGCQAEGGYYELQPRAESVGTWISGGGENVGVCRSKPLQIKGRVVEFEFAGYPSGEESQEAYLEVLPSDGRPPVRVNLPYPHLIHLAESWRRWRIELEDLPRGGTVSFRLVDKASIPHGGWLAMRDRVSFFEPNEHITALKKVLDQYPVSTFILLGIATLLLVLLRGPLGTADGVRWFAFLAFLGLGTLFRSDLYFYWDEWHLFARVLERGWRIVFETHNEHFIPLFLGTFLLESKIFGDRYLAYIVFGILLHAVNGVLLTNLLEKLIDGSESGKRAIRWLVVLFTINALHCSVLHWAFLQAILFCHFFTLSALLLGWNFIADGKSKNLILCVICTIVAPLYFGGGLIISLQLGLLTLFGLPWMRLYTEGGWRAIREHRWFRRGCRLAGFLALAGVALIALYAVPRTGSGYGVDVPNIPHRFGNITKLVGYIFVGSELGSVIRGLGLFPITELEATMLIFPPEWMQLFDRKLYVVLAIGVFGLLFFGPYLYLIFRLSKQPSLQLRYLLLGQTILFSSLFLQALGRSRWGMLMSLAPRYQYAALLGLLIMLLPLVQWMFARLHERKYLGLVTTALIFPLVLHLFWIERYNFFGEVGEMNSGFVSQMHEWRNLTRGEATSKPAAGLAPLIPWRLAPTFDPDQVFEVLRNLSGRVE